MSAIDNMRLKAHRQLKNRITFAGSTVQSDGSFSQLRVESHQISGNTFTITIQAASAAVVTIN